VAPGATPLPESEDEQPDTSPVTRVVIPSLDLDAVAAYIPYEGETWLIQGLRQEVAWLGNTSWPGLGGNTGLAAHVTVRGEGNGPFRYIMNLVQGDTIQLYTEQNIYTYQVRDKVAIEETDLSVLQPTGGSQLTLITCVEWDESLMMYIRRLAVRADLVEVERIMVRGGR
jgi:LPXTG-site transpeptidase (sortase) family protein